MLIGTWEFGDILDCWHKGAGVYGFVSGCTWENEKWMHVLTGWWSGRLMQPHANQSSLNLWWWWLWDKMQVKPYGGPVGAQRPCRSAWKASQAIMDLWVSKHFQLCKVSCLTFRDIDLSPIAPMSSTSGKRVRTCGAILRTDLTRRLQNDVALKTTQASCNTCTIDFS